MSKPATNKSVSSADATTSVMLYRAQRPISSRFSAVHRVAAWLSDTQTHCTRIHSSDSESPTRIVNASLFHLCSYYALVAIRIVTSLSSACVYTYIVATH